MCVLIFSTIFVWNISHSKKNWTRYDQKCILVFTWSTRYSSPILIWVFSTIFRKLKYQISWISVQWEPCCYMRTDRHDEVIQWRFALLCNFYYHRRTRCMPFYILKSTLLVCLPPFLKHYSNLSRRFSITRWGVFSGIAAISSFIHCFSSSMFLGVRDKILLLRYPTKSNHKQWYQLNHQAMEHRRNEKLHIVETIPVFGLCEETKLSLLGIRKSTRAPSAKSPQR